MKNIRLLVLLLITFVSSSSFAKSIDLSIDVNLDRYYRVRLGNYKYFEGKFEEVELCSLSNRFSVKTWIDINVGTSTQFMIVIDEKGVKKNKTIYITIDTFEDREIGHANLTIKNYATRENEFAPGCYIEFFGEKGDKMPFATGIRYAE